MGCTQEIDSLYHNFSSPPTDPQELKLVVAVRNLRFQYHDVGAPLLDIPAWSVGPGERVFLQGPSGSGKSTLLNLLAGVLLPSAGEIEILGKRLDQMSGGQRDRWRAQTIGVVFQQFNLIPYLNAVDNIRLAAYFGPQRVANDAAEELLRALNIEESMFHRPTSQLSIGQQQRVAIARALVNRPALLIADEPTSSLDARNRDLFIELLLTQAEASDTAVVFVSHDPSLAEYFPRVEPLVALNQAAGTDQAAGDG